MPDGCLPSPDTQLAELIVEKLRQQKLIPANRIPELKANIAKGAVRQEDWRSMIELALPRQTDDKQEGRDE